MIAKITTNHKTDSVISQIIETLRYPLVVAVVFVHASGISNEHVEISLSNTQVAVDSVRYVFSKIICQTAVPTFFFMSGFLFYENIDKWDWKIYRKKINKRFRSIIIPFIVWTLMSILVVLCMKGTALMVGIKSLNKETFNFLFDVESWIGGPFNYHLWYLRELIILVLISPFLYFGIKRLKVAFIVLLILIYLNDSRDFTCTFCSLGLVTFSTGGLLSISNIDFAETVYHKRVILSAISIVLLTICTISYGTPMFGVVYKLFILTGIATIFALAPRKPIKFNGFSISSFFVYLSHVYLLPVTGALLPLLTVHNPIMELFVYFVRPLLVCVMCSYICRGIKSMSPPTMKVLTGGR